MEADLEFLALGLRLDELQRMRLQEMAERYPQETTRMAESGDLRGYLESWRQSAEDLLEALMNPRMPGNAWLAAGATEALKASDYPAFLRRAEMVPSLAREMMVREMVLAPLAPVEA